MIELYLEEAIRAWVAQIVRQHDDSRLAGVATYAARSGTDVDDSSRVVVFADDRLSTGIERSGNYRVPVDLQVITHGDDESLADSALTVAQMHAARAEELDDRLARGDQAARAVVTEEINSVAEEIVVTGYMRAPDAPRGDFRDRTHHATVLRYHFDVLR